jgi:hypothetical protein
LSTSAIAEKVIKYSNARDANGVYAQAMLKLAFAHVDQHYTFEEIGEDLTQPRQVEEVRDGKLDVMWTATSQELEDTLLPVRIPLYKGLLGHRILLIRAGDQARFDQVHTLDDLRRIPIGQGTFWSDTKILEANGLKVIKAAKTPSLFFMLDGGRYDGFPRGVFEPFGEVAGHPNLNLAVEKRLMLVYKMPYYFFVSPNNKQLGHDLELGLNRAIADGSFEKVFLSSPNVQEAIQKGDLKNRIIFNLNNPGLPKETPVDRPELWVDPKAL